jgi:hypothetical protein
MAKLPSTRKVDVVNLQAIRLALRELAGTITTRAQVEISRGDVGESLLIMSVCW